jgi:predicted MFS family arabinose efflux permease
MSEAVEDILPGEARQSPCGAISRGLVAVLAVACGLAVANLYYAQPLLHALAGAFGTTPVGAGMVVTLTQLGYAAGLLFLVPLGDRLDRRSLVVVILVLAAISLAGSALANGLQVFELMALAVGCTSVVAQVLVPLAADLATPDRRGQVVGTVMSGLLIGILLSRTLSGLVASVAGWRTVYWLAALAMVLLAATLRLVLPADRPCGSMGYPALLRSTARLVREEPVLRRRALLGALGFAAFSALWTTIAFLLSGPPYHYGLAVIGLFGLVGAAGAVCASFAGRLADAGWARPATLAFAVSVGAAFLLLVPGRSLLLPLIAGIVFLDVGVQGIHITNQTLIYRLRGDAWSRITSAYMTAYFVGGAAGSGGPRRSTPDGGGRACACSDCPWPSAWSPSGLGIYFGRMLWSNRSEGHARHIDVLDHPATPGTRTGVLWAIEACMASRTAVLARASARENRSGDRPRMAPARCSTSSL